MTDFKAAIDSLDTVEHFVDVICPENRAIYCSVDVIRSALEAAAREAECWRVIDSYSAHTCITQPGGHVFAFTVTVEAGQLQAFFDGTTRLKGLALAAEWCAKELAK